MNCGLYRFFILLFICLGTINAQNLKKVTIQLSWFDQFQFAGYYMAKEKGFFKEYGLDVEIRPFAFGIDIPKEISDNKIDFAVGRETLILDKSNGKNIVALYALFQSTPLILLSTKESNISNINDFKNKNIMTTIDDASEVSIKAMIRSKNVSLEDLNFLKHTHSIDDLINKKTDVISAYISKSPFVLQQKGIEYNIFDPKSYGFDMYSDLLYTSNHLIQNDIKTVRAFKKASLMGWEYAYSNIEESAEFLFKNHNSQELSKDELIYEAKELKKLSYFNTDSLGEIKKEKIQRIYDLYNVMGLISKKVNFDDFIYNEKELNSIELSKEQQTYLKDKKEISICVAPNAMPYSNIKNGKVEGFSADLVNILEKKMNISFKLIKTDTWSDSLEFARNKVCDILPSAAISKDRKEYLNFTDTYTEVPTVIITKNNIPFINNLGSLDAGIKVSVTKGYALHDALRKKYENIEFITVENTFDGLKKVEQGKFYGHITTLGTAWYMLQKNFVSKLKISGKIDDKLALRVGVRKDDIFLYEILSKVINSIDKNEIQRIENKWAYIEYKKEFDYKLLWQIIALITIILIVVLYRQKFLKDLNKELNKKVEEKTQELRKVNHSLEDRIKKEVEENLRKDRILAQQTKMASMGEMIENIAHQWRQPLSVISTGASGLKIKKQINDLDNEFFIETLDRIIASSKYLSHTIDDFRFFFKPNKAKTEFFVDHSVEKTLNLLSSKFENENISIHKNINKVKISGFETELIQVFINILNNAKDALEGLNSHEKLIFIEVEKVKNKTIIRIKDNAGGINHQIINKVFEPYFTTKHKRQGTGIGLYMCDQIIAKYMNGLIEVSNSKFKYNQKNYIGAEFLIILYDE